LHRSIPTTCALTGVVTLFIALAVFNKTSSSSLPPVVATDVDGQSVTPTSQIRMSSMLLLQTLRREIAGNFSAHHYHMHRGSGGYSPGSDRGASGSIQGKVDLG
jgi:hypothetical protein